MYVYIYIYIYIYIIYVIIILQYLYSVYIDQQIVFNTAVLCFSQKQVNFISDGDKRNS